MPRRENDTRSRIRETALELFASQGVDKTSLREIAERLDITKAALYYHFPSKKDLLTELIQPLFDDVETLLDDAERTGDLAPRVLLGRYFDVTARHRALFLALLYDLGTLIELDVVTRIFQWRDRLQRLLVGPAPRPAEIAACTLAVGGVQDCAITVEGPSAAEEYREAALDAACRALGVDTAGTQ
ncbi:AcrR family transcriptional regulator [Lipingzhangella halophila]|uniref:AcrR family transcriptional regulator n=1 Tax=Lipingzhangella halophila TaxID=1783352 RepID=A0A7W7RCZ9_9ACTN|nr:TetR/AcrR family transcriptional regulator [Lipingzhangella halophila]MBB4929736.1 AcrR family transcriptional regulator [Lipingzhangella halophila]